jgi:hypothetical protein
VKRRSGYGSRAHNGKQRRVSRSHVAGERPGKALARLIRRPCSALGRKTQGEGALPRLRPYVTADEWGKRQAVVATWTFSICKTPPASRAKRPRKSKGLREQNSQWTACTSVRSACRPSKTARLPLFDWRARHSGHPARSGIPASGSGSGGGRNRTCVQLANKLHRLISSPSKSDRRNAFSSLSVEALLTPAHPHSLVHGLGQVSQHPDGLAMSHKIHMTR